MTFRPTVRMGFALGAAACALLLSYAFYLQYAAGQEPCPLCLVQRSFYVALLVVFAVAAIHGPQRIGRLIYSLLALIPAAAGGATAARQVWLQHLPADQVPQCGPDLYVMLERFPLSKVLTNLLRGSGQCAEVKWTFLGLSIAEWSLAWFVLLGALIVWLALRRDR